jgi:hypothetical protein
LLIGAANRGADRRAIVSKRIVQVRSVFDVFIGVIRLFPEYVTWTLGAEKGDRTPEDESGKKKECR